MQRETSGTRHSPHSAAGAPSRLAVSLSTIALVTLCLGCGTTPAFDSTPRVPGSTPKTLDATPNGEVRANPAAVSAQGVAAPIAAFSAERAWRDLQMLTKDGGRPVGSRNNARAREYLREQLEDVGLKVESWDVDYRKSGQASPAADAPKIPVTNLSAIIPGTRSQDRFLLVAPFDSRHFDDFEFVGANDGASGAAVVLEVARVLAADPLPYATEIVFLDGESPFSAPDGQKGFYREIGSLGLASRLQEQGIAGVRVLVYLNRVGDADLRIARDLMSHRIYREEFWKAAAALDRTQAFPRDAAFENVGMGHPNFAEIGLRQVVTIEDTAFGGDQPPGLYADTAQDTIERCSPDSLQTVGVVVLGALDAIAGRLGKIDRFAGSLGEATWR
jgi:glutaminyl-peptide cyclotransferase